MISSTNSSQGAQPQFREVLGRAADSVLIQKTSTALEVQLASMASLNRLQVEFNPITKPNPPFNQAASLLQQTIVSFKGNSLG